MSDPSEPSVEELRARFAQELAYLLWGKAPGIVVHTLDAWISAKIREAMQVRDG